jgi:S-formylglutathione hydrolase FrmB
MRSKQFLHYSSLFITLVASTVSAYSFDGTIWSNPKKTPPGIHHEVFFSTAIGRKIGYNIYLPPAYRSQSRTSFPTIYFLHRKLGDESTESRVFSDWLRSGGSLSAIVVFPNGGRNSKYMDSVAGSEMDGKIMMETALTKELVPHIDAHYRTIRNPEGRSIQGFSMGGMGALRLAFAYPHLFGRVYAFNPAVDDDAENIAEEEPELLLKMMGSNPSEWHERMAKTLGLRNIKKLKNSLIDISIGDRDELLHSVLDLSKALRAAGLPHTLKIIPELDHWYRLGPNFDQILQPINE